MSGSSGGYVLLGLICGAVLVLGAFIIGALWQPIDLSVVALDWPGDVITQPK
jgi:hypothetical protein